MTCLVKLLDRKLQVLKLAKLTNFGIFFFQVALDTTYWTWLNHLAIWGSLIFYFALQYFYNYVLQGAYVGSLSTVISSTLYSHSCNISCT